MASERKFFVGGNWKMNGTKKDIDGIINFLSAGPLDPNTGNLIRLFCFTIHSWLCYHGKLRHFVLEVVVGVPTCYLDYCAQKVPSNVAVAAQNCYKAPKGAFTGLC